MSADVIPLPITPAGAFRDSEGVVWDVEELKKKGDYVVSRLVGWPRAGMALRQVAATISTLPPQALARFSVRVVIHSKDGKATYSVQACVDSLNEAVKLGVRLFQQWTRDGACRPGMTLEELQRL